MAFLQTRIGAVLLFTLILQVCLAEPTTYDVGAGIADVTGPAADINMVYIKLFVLFPFFINRFNRWHAIRS